MHAWAPELGVWGDAPLGGGHGELQRGNECGEDDEGEELLPDAGALHDRRDRRDDSECGPRARESGLRENKNDSVQRTGMERFRPSKNIFSCI